MHDFEFDTDNHNYRERCTQLKEHGNNHMRNEFQNFQVCIRLVLLHCRSQKPQREVKYTE